MVFVYFVLVLSAWLFHLRDDLCGCRLDGDDDAGGRTAGVADCAFMLVAGFYLSFNVIRSPNSSLAFWASMFPFFCADYDAGADCD